MGLSKWVRVIFLLGVVLTVPAVAVYSEDSSQGTEKMAATEKERPATPNLMGRSPEEVKQQMEQVMGPMMGLMMGQMIEGMSKAMAKPEVASNFATFAHNYYLALVKQGFTEEEAMKIVTSAGIPSVGGKQ